MINIRFCPGLGDSSVSQQEIVVVTTKQYLAIADDFLRKLFPEVTPDRLPYPGPLTVLVIDDYSVLH